MLTYAPILIPVGLSLFVLRSQLLRVAILELGIENVHESKEIGAASGWASLFGALVLCGLAFVVMGPLWGIGLIIVGLALGVINAALFLPMLGHTTALGMHGGEGNKSIAAFNRRYGHWIAFSVAGIALLCLYVVSSFRF